MMVFWCFFFIRILVSFGRADGDDNIVTWIAINITKDTYWFKILEV